MGCERGALDRAPRPSGRESNARGPAGAPAGRSRCSTTRTPGRGGQLRACASLPAMRAARLVGPCRMHGEVSGKNFQTGAERGKCDCGVGEPGVLGLA